eukprot:COSAG01_NODE_66157_length_271_cov_0.598837_1_plen_32_part_10
MQILVRADGTGGAVLVAATKRTELYNVLIEFN